MKKSVFFAFILISNFSVSAQPAPDPAAQSAASAHQTTPAVAAPEMQKEITVDAQNQGLTKEEAAQAAKIKLLGESLANEVASFIKCPVPDPKTKKIDSETQEYYFLQSLRKYVEQVKSLQGTLKKVELMGFAEALTAKVSSPSKKAVSSQVAGAITALFNDLKNADVTKDFPKQTKIYDILNNGDGANLEIWKKNLGGYRKNFDAKTGNDLASDRDESCKKDKKAELARRASSQVTAKQEDVKKIADELDKNTEELHKLAQASTEPKAKELTEDQIRSNLLADNKYYDRQKKALAKATTADSALSLAQNLMQAALTMPTKTTPVPGSSTEAPKVGASVPVEVSAPSKPTTKTYIEENQNYERALGNGKDKIPDPNKVNSKSLAALSQLKPNASMDDKIKAVTDSAYYARVEGPGIKKMHERLTGGKDAVSQAELYKNFDAIVKDWGLDTPNCEEAKRQTNLRSCQQILGNLKKAMTLALSDAQKKNQSLLSEAQKQDSAVADADSAKRRTSYDKLSPEAKEKLFKENLTGADGQLDPKKNPGLYTALSRYGVINSTGQYDPKQFANALEKKNFYADVGPHLSLEKPALITKGMKADGVASAVPPKAVQAATSPAAPAPAASISPPASVDTYQASDVTLETGESSGYKIKDGNKKLSVAKVATFLGHDKKQLSVALYIEDLPKIYTSAEAPILTKELANSVSKANVDKIIRTAPELWSNKNMGVRTEQTDKIWQRTQKSPKQQVLLKSEIKTLLMSPTIVIYISPEDAVRRGLEAKAQIFTIQDIEKFITK